MKSRFPRTPFFQLCQDASALLLLSKALFGFEGLLSDDDIPLCEGRIAQWWYESFQEQS